MTHPRAPVAVWRSVRSLPDFWRLLELRMASQFGDGLFQAGLAGALLFNPERATRPLAIAGAFAVLFLPYSLLGPFAGALMDRWDRRLVLIAANVGRVVSVAVVGICLALGAGNFLVLCGALVVNGLARFVASGLSAALPHVVPREQVVTMNSIASAVGAVAAFLGANFMLVPRALFGSGDTWRRVDHLPGHRPAADRAAAVAAIRGPRAGSRRHPAGDPRVGRLRRGHRLAAWPAHRAGPSHRRRHPVRVGRSPDGVRHQLAAGAAAGAQRRAAAVSALGSAMLFVAAAGAGSFLANLVTPLAVRRWGRYAAANGALAIAAAIEIAGVGLRLWVLVACGFLLGGIGQVVKLCADTAIQIDVDDALRGHVFAVQDSLFWVAFIAAITAAASVIPADGHSPALIVAGAVVYLCGLAAHSVVGARANR